MIRLGSSSLGLAVADHADGAGALAALMCRLRRRVIAASGCCVASSRWRWLGRLRSVRDRLAAFTARVPHLSIGVSHHFRSRAVVRASSCRRAQLRGRSKEG